MSAEQYWWKLSANLGALGNLHWEPETSLKILAAIFDGYLEILQYPW